MVFDKDKERVPMKFEKCKLFDVNVTFRVSVYGYAHETLNEDVALSIVRCLDLKRARDIGEMLSALHPEAVRGISRIGWYATRGYLDDNVVVSSTYLPPYPGIGEIKLPEKPQVADRKAPPWDTQQK